jgi:hypothetical protein
MKLAVICAIVGLGLSTVVQAQQVNVPGLGFKLGDDIAVVRANLHTNQDTEPLSEVFVMPFNTVNAGKTVLHLRAKGVWVYLKKDTVESIKLDAPFGGSIGGIKLGDSEHTVRAALGKPIRVLPMGLNKSFTYVLDDSAYLRFDINDNDGVQTIYVQR